MSEIVDHFSRSSAPAHLPVFRSLCNALKASLIDYTLTCWSRLHKSPRLLVVDAGCGKGGDLHKWIKNRPKIFVGLDASAASIDEARQRYSSLASRGRTNMTASFHVCDFRHSPFPVEASTVDVVSSQFALQFLFDRNESIQHFVAELQRTLKPNGFFVAIFPDGDQVAKTLCVDKQRRFGHFCLSTFEYTLDMFKNADPPIGIPYTFKFSEDSESCAEWVVAPRYLEAILEQAGFLPEFTSGFTMPAPEFFEKFADQHDVTAIMKTYRASFHDWQSVAFFRVCIARKG